MGFSAASGNSTPSVRARVWVRPRVRRPSRRHSTAPVWPTGAETFRVWPWREGVPIFLCECLGRAWGPPALNPPASPAAAALPAHTHPHMYVHWSKPESAERVRAECMPAHRTRAPGLPVCAPPAHPCVSTTHVCACTSCVRRHPSTSVSHQTSLQFTSLNQGTSPVTRAQVPAYGRPALRASNSMSTLSGHRPQGSPEIKVRLCTGQVPQ